jgi:hypothetical protein
MIERIYIKEIKKEFGCKDYRTVRNWCRNHGVQIFCDKGSRLHYVLKSEFENAKDQEPKKYLTTKYGDGNMPDNLNSTINLSNLLKIESVVRDTQISVIRKYKPQGKQEKDFLVKLQKITPEL